MFSNFTIKFSVHLIGGQKSHQTKTDVAWRQSLGNSILPVTRWINLQKHEIIRSTSRLIKD